MNIMEFSVESSSSEGWGTWKFSFGKSSLGLATQLITTNWSTRWIEHSISVHFRKEDGSFFVYTGNIEDLFAQVSKALKPIHIARIADKFQV